jgi:hypothetical protein
MEYRRRTLDSFFDDEKNEIHVEIPLKNNETIKTQLHYFIQNPFYIILFLFILIVLYLCKNYHLFK